ncbi:MAG: sigma-70 family RNA polymerase sigma factor [Muribaculaceae bacterium]|nr:sigma-70 family RNA polymerase sigma factor [Muribaculaceae bacterium]
MAFSTAIDEKQLIEDLQRESTANKAFELLMRTFSEPLYWQIRKMVYNHDDANDLLQNVFLKAWNNIHNFRGDAKLSTWLYKIAVNEAINFINREKSRQNISADTDDTSFLLDRLEADEYFDGDELHEDLLKEIAKLPEKQRLVFNMKYFDEMKYEEISDILGTSVGALKASYHHAVKKLTKAFGLAATLGFLILTSLTVMAVPASPDILTHTQPDGSVMEFRLIGDENHHYMVSLEGQELRIDPDGWMRPIAKSERVYASESGQLPAVNPPKYLLSGSSFPCEGSPRALVVLVMFKERFFSVENPQDYYSRMLNEEGFSDNFATGSARDFFIENSGGRFAPQFDVYGPVKMQQPMSYYGENDIYGYDLHPEEIVIEALDALVGKVDFTKYDTDGDGVIDNVYIFYAGYGEQDSGTQTLIWPHSADILDFELDRDYYFDGLLLNRYAMSNELRANTTVPDGIGTFVHEFSHVLGLPDFYATAYTGAFTPGRFSTMDMAPYNNNGRTPAYYSIFERMCLGWADPIEITEPGEYSLRPIHESNTGFLIPTENPDEFYLLENRQQVIYDKYIPGHGMLVWHIDFDQDIWDRNVLNNNRNHQRIDLVEADNRQSDATRQSDPFPGHSTVTRFTTKSSPALLSWAGKPLPVTDITDIREDEDGTIRFNAAGTTLGIDNSLSPSSSNDITSSDGRLFNHSDSETAMIYDTSGRLISSLLPGQSVVLPAGLYIVRSGEDTIKLLNR